MRPRALFIVPTCGISAENPWTVPQWSYPKLPPLGLISIISFLHDKGFQVDLLDCYELAFQFRTLHVEPLLTRAVGRLRPYLTGLSIPSAAFGQARELARLIKEQHPTGLLIAGGPHPSVEPALTLEQIPWLDGVCVGPGEDVCREIMDGVGLDRIAGLMVRGGEDRFTRRIPTEDLDALPFPDFRLVNHSFYADYSVWFRWLSRSLTVVASRGCPHSCRFCASEWNRPVRYHSVDYVVELARFLNGLDVDMLDFCDDTLALNPGRLSALCEGFIRSGLFQPEGRLRWRGLLRADEARPELLRLMKRAGCMQVGIGIESGSDRILETLKKNTTVETNRQGCSRVKEAGLDLLVSYMMGMPGETEEEIRATLEFVRSLRCNAKACLSFTAMPGSSFYKEFTENGLLDKRSLDWSHVGSYHLPRSEFCRVEHSRFMDLFSEGMALAANPGRVLVHRDVATRCRPLIRQIRQERTVVIVRSDRDLGRVRASDRLANAWAKAPWRRHGRAFSGVQRNPRALLKGPVKILGLARRRLLRQH